MVNAKEYKAGSNNTLQKGNNKNLLKKFLDIAYKPAKNSPEDKRVGDIGIPKRLGGFAGLGSSDALVVIKELSLRAAVGLALADRVKFDDKGLIPENGSRLPLFFSPAQITGRVVWLTNEKDNAGVATRNQNSLNKNCPLEGFFKSTADNKFSDFLFCELEWKQKPEKDSHKANGGSSQGTPSPNGDSSLLTLKEALIRVQKALCPIVEKFKLKKDHFLFIEVIGRPSLIILIKGFKSLNIVHEVHSALNDLAQDISLTPFFTSESTCKVFKDEEPKEKPEYTVKRVSRMVNVLPSNSHGEITTPDGAECYYTGGGFNLIFHWNQDKNKTLTLGNLFEEYQKLLQYSNVRRGQNNVVWKKEEYTNTTDGTSQPADQPADQPAGP
ncbi:MAG: hypothetical protein HQK56_07660 [Deltaproteobacteria bacterium]|nr:hypothetical protein [Deltaproteobacteria bacterium]